MRKHIVCFGDSNTFGFNPETNGRYDEDHRWTCLLQKKLGNSYLVLEEGLNGRSTVFDDPLFEGLSGINYIHPCLMSHKPIDLLIIMLGTNDTKERFGVTPTCIGTGLKRLILKAQTTTEFWANGNPNILVISPKNIGDKYYEKEISTTMGNGCYEKSLMLAKVFEQIAALTNCHFMDANQYITANPCDVDVVHLTAEGHRQLADALSQLIPTLI